MEKAAYELGRAEVGKETAVVTEELKKVRDELAETKWSLRVTTQELEEISVIRPGRLVEEERDQLRSNLNNQLSQDTRTISELQQRNGRQSQWIKTLTVQKENQELEIENLQDETLAKENTELQKTIDFLHDEADEGNDLSDRQVKTIEELRDTIAERDETIEKLKSRLSTCTYSASNSESATVGTLSIPQSEELGHAQTSLTSEPQLNVAPTQESKALEEERDDLRAQLDRQASEINRLRNLPEQCDIEQISAESAERFERINEQERLIEKLRNLPGRANELDHENQVLHDQILDLELVIEDQDNSLYWTTQARWFLENLQAEAVAGQVSLMRLIRGLEIWRWEQYRIVDLATIDQGVPACTEHDSQPTPEGEFSRDDEPGAGDTMMGTEQDGVRELQPSKGEARETGAGDTMMRTEQAGVREPQPPNGEAYETGVRMTGVEDYRHGQAILPNDNESDVANEVADPSSYTGFEAGDVVMGHVNDEDVSHTPSPPDVANSDLKGLVDDLADRIEQLNLGRDLLDTPIPTLIGQTGPVHGVPPYWAMVNIPPPTNYFPVADNGSWGSQTILEEEEEEL